LIIIATSVIVVILVITSKVKSWLCILHINILLIISVIFLEIELSIVKWII